MNDPSIRATAAPSMLIIFESFAVPMFLLFLYGAVFNHAEWGGAVIAGALCILIFVWWRSFLLQITDGELVYQSLLRRRKVKLNNIMKAVRKIDLVSHGSRPPNRLEIHSVGDDRTLDFDINMKPFRPGDIKKIEALLQVRGASGLD
ncbi:hypothetical protein HDE76_000229 [Rhodanobacter sp. ANJX3]|uniref:hypothetical protein n=1 Tax=unclassified Rhodanobacter TaxID=2621553 RepID=UPI0015CA3A2A|nr:MULTISPECIES: hypothetical protein [unclassified Rhodanobacter]MBB5357047.1 hypothetical protein [Rhodanobacter sp. ANJX3]NYE27119.1 hypothetical protein [Rhodanobacter sp. K2T2]